MSKQKGLIKLVGTIGGVTFYNSDGEYLARMAGGPTKERIQNDPSFVRTRENNVEFGGAAKVGKAFRTALSGVLQTMAGRRLTGQLTKLFKSINLKGVGVRGKRPFTLTANKNMIKGLDLDKKLSLTSVFSAPFTVSANDDRNEVSFSIASFTPSNLIDAPSGATHFKIVGAIGLVSNYHFNDETGSYEPEVPEEDSLGVVIGSTVRSLEANSNAINLTATIPDGILPDDAVSVIACLGIEFYQEAGGTNYILAQGNTMRVVNVF